MQNSLERTVSRTAARAAAQTAGADRAVGDSSRQRRSADQTVPHARRIRAACCASRPVVYVRRRRVVWPAQCAGPVTSGEYDAPGRSRRVFAGVTRGVDVTDMESTHKRGMRLTLSQMKDQIMRFVLCSPSLSSDLRNTAMHGVLNWVHCDLVSIVDLQTVGLLEVIFACIKSEETFDAAVECVCEVLALPDLQRYPSTLRAQLVTGLLALDDPFKKALKDEDEDVCKGIAKIVATLGEHSTSLVVDVQDPAHQLLPLLLQCTIHPVPEVSMIMLDFWYEFKEAVAASTHEVRTFYINSTLFPTLVSGLVSCMRYPEESMEWPVDVREEFQLYRNEVRETLLYIYTLIEARCLECISLLLSEAVSPLSSCDNAKSLADTLASFARWSLIETCINAVRAVSEGT
eukprot:TRINITY_DN13997_c0_g1_i1.p1 TRINITY_DN13997_c0_g1~~TRINITY_DN13997_c0_g1_i1.p1  ORF type:complete len:403 (-),score=35.34 TRINITY_DN13997_c0_g1_i1:66-1274(-)